MTRSPLMPPWALLAPAAGWLLLAVLGATDGLGLGANAQAALLAPVVVVAVLAAVHHAEVIAHRVGEPFGTLVLAAAVTVIELALIVSLMLIGERELAESAQASGGMAAGDAPALPATAALARDTVFATVMIILNGIVGLCLLAGGSRFGEQSFGRYGVNAALATLAAITVLTLVLPNVTTTVPGPYYSASQLGLVAVVSLLLYGVFVFVQAVRHREYFLPAPLTVVSEPGAVAAAPSAPTAMPSNRMTWLALALLLACLGAVVLLAKAIAPAVEAAVVRAGAPHAVVGVAIAAMVLLPEGLAAWRAARANRLQVSLNLALGSALATIGLTIPAVALISLATGWTLTLGIDLKASVLLFLTLMVATLSLGTGRTTVLQGAVHLVIFAVYLFTTVVP